MFIIKLDEDDYITEIVDDPLHVGSLTNVEVVIKEETVVIQANEVLVLPA